MNHSSQLHPLQHVQRACARLGQALWDTKYALVGGAACLILGSTRATEDIDLVVVKGGVVAARKLIAADQETFTVEPRTRHTYYLYPPSMQIEIDILAPPGTFREPFDLETSTVIVPLEEGSVSVLHPALILNAKCKSILGRGTDGKKLTDALDIKFLLGYLAEVGYLPGSESLPNVSNSFVEWFVEKYGGVGLWTAANIDATSGTLLHA